MNIIKKLPAKKKLLISAAALILVLALVLMLLPRREAMPQSSVNVVKELITGTAETGSITETFVSGGTIASVGARFSRRLRKTHRLGREQRRLRGGRRPPRNRG